MSTSTKTKLLLVALCIGVATWAYRDDSAYAKGFQDGIASSDQQAFDAYVGIAKNMAEEKKAMQRTSKQPRAKADDVFARAGF